MSRDRRAYARTYGKKRRAVDPKFRAAIARTKWRHKLKVKYNLTEAAYQALLNNCSHACEACRVPLGETNTAIDHDHETKVVRGILCRRCNTALGMVDDNPVTLRRLAEYLKK